MRDRMAHLGQQWLRGRWAPRLLRLLAIWEWEQHVCTYGGRGCCARNAHSRRHS
jgi:hypothetical protein